MRAFRFVRAWEDLDLVFRPGDKIFLTPALVAKVEKQIATWGPQADLVQIGKYRVPFNFLEELKKVNHDRKESA